MSNVKCESCGGNNTFEPEAGMLVCERCGRKIGVQLNHDNDDFLVRKYTYGYVPKIREAGGNQYICSTCGASVSFEDNEERKRCPSCGDVSLVKEKKAMFVPDGIMPFEIAKDKAREVFKKWISTRKFTPNDLKEMAKMGKISGIYVPVFNFNFQIKARYNATVTKVEERGDDCYTRTIYLDNKIEKTFKNVMISGNTRINDSTLDKLEPYDTMKIRSYSNDFVFGFSGLDTNVDIHSSFENTVKNKEKEMESRLRGELHGRYDSIVSLDMEYSCNGSTFNYVYVPIWANHYHYNGKEYHCFINGQTGKATGKTPKSFWKIFALVGGIAAAVAGVLLAILL